MSAQREAAEVSFTRSWHSSRRPAGRGRPEIPLRGVLALAGEPIFRCEEPNGRFERDRIITGAVPEADATQLLNDAWLRVLAGLDCCRVGVESSAKCAN